MKKTDATFKAELTELEEEEKLSQLETEFRATFEKVHPEIQAKLEEAARLINEACALAEEHGVPFRPKKRLVFIAPSYIPRSFAQKFPELYEEYDLWADITGAHGSDEGWQYSQTC